MNNIQKLITHVRDFLVLQNERSMNTNPSGEEKCAYRGKEGRMCAVGCLIPDEIYQADMEYKTVWSFMTKFPSVISQIGQKFELSETEQKNSG